jgi:Cu/Ag efflux pump CusA
MRKCFSMTAGALVRVARSLVFTAAAVNTMLQGGLALAFSRLIDDSVVVLENIFRFMETGVQPQDAAEKGGMEVSLAVLAATSTTSIVFFPATFLSGVSKYIFTPLAQARYKLGLSGIVELSQAQLGQTEAEIAYANALCVSDRTS